MKSHLRLVRIPRQAESVYHSLFTRTSPYAWLECLGSVTINFAYVAGWTYVKLYISVVMRQPKILLRRDTRCSYPWRCYENIKYQQIHSNKPCRKFFNRKLIFTTRGWIRKQKNETTNLYLKKLAQYFGLKDKPSSVAKRKLKVLNK